MSVKTALFAAFALAAVAGAAEAKTLTAVAKLDAPVPEKVRVVADHAVWVCEADSCAATLAEPATLRGCKDLTRKVGRISTYGAEDKPLAADDLATCNNAAPATLQAQK